MLCLLVLAGAAPLAHASVYRCIGAHGEMIFTGEPCGAPAPAASVGAKPATAINGNALLYAACPGSPQVLRDRLAGAFDSGDPNALSGLFLWDSVDPGSAHSIMRGFARMLKRPLVGIDLRGANAPPPTEVAVDPALDASSDVAMPAADASIAPPPHIDELVVRTQSAGTDDAASDAHVYGVVRRGGCWWLTF